MTYFIDEIIPTVAGDFVVYNGVKYLVSDRDAKCNRCDIYKSDEKCPRINCNGMILRRVEDAV
jgi:hypothetical protein